MRETDNPLDNYAVSIIRNSYVVGHVPLGLSKTFSNFLSLPASTFFYMLMTSAVSSKGNNFKKYIFSK